MNRAKYSHVRNGFTLIELVIVIAILGILALIAVPRLSGYSEQAKQASDKVTFEVVEKALEMAVAQGTVKPLATNGTVTLHRDGTLSSTDFPSLDTTASAASGGTVIDDMAIPSDRVLKSDEYGEITFTILPDGEIAAGTPVSTGGGGSTTQAMPVFSPVAGAVPVNTVVTISSTNAEFIYYTLDGSVPNTSGGGSTFVFTGDSGDVTITSGVTIRAIATRTSYTNSAVASASYTISGTAIVPVTSIAVTGQSGATSIATDGGTLQMIETVLPSNATNKAVTWSVDNNTIASINSVTGLLTALTNGNVVVTATANDGSGIFGNSTIAISGQVAPNIPVSSVVITNIGDITTLGGTRTLGVTVDPGNATDRSVTWAITPATVATIDQTGVVTAVGNGQATVTVTANDGSGAFDSDTINVSGQNIAVTAVTISGDITFASGSYIDLSALVAPGTATDKSIIWSVYSGTATLSNQTNTSARVSSSTVGTVEIRATSVSNNTVFGNHSITVTAPKPSAPTTVALGDYQSGDNRYNDIRVSGGVTLGETITLYRSVSQNGQYSVYQTATANSSSRADFYNVEYGYYRATRTVSSVESDLSSSTAVYIPSAPTSVAVRDTDDIRVSGGVTSGETITLYKSGSQNGQYSVYRTASADVNNRADFTSVEYGYYRATRTLSGVESDLSTSTAVYWVAAPGSVNKYGDTVYVYDNLENGALVTLYVSDTQNGTYTKTTITANASWMGGWFDRYVASFHESLLQNKYYKATQTISGYESVLSTDFW